MTQPTDTVDRITAQWRRERPDLDSSPMNVIGRISRISILMQRELERVFAERGISGGDFDVLASMRRSGAPYQLTPGQLSRATLVTTGGMTKRIDRLEAKGLVRRRPDPDDRRGALIELTDAGRALVDEVAGAHFANEERLLAGMSPAKREQLAGLLREMLRSLEGPLERQAAS
jgi:DNA-binding MarR family transcriptional regulator